MVVVKGVGVGVGVGVERVDDGNPGRGNNVLGEGLKRRSGD